MSTNAHVFDVTPDNFETEVLQASSQTPILIDFWATWCGPCKALGPLLEKLAAEYNGAFRLAKIDVDANQELAAMFGIRSVPTVALIQDGRPVDGFAGALPEGQLREFLSKHVEPASLIETPDDLDSDAPEGTTESAADAVQRIRAEMAARPDDESLKLDLALAQLRAGDFDAARAALDALPANLATDDRTARLRGQLQLAEALDDAPDADALRQRIEADPEDWSARDLLGVRLTLGDAPAEGLDQFLHILRHQRDWNEGLARQRLLAAFQILEDSALVGDYRRRMASILF
ncbi:thioredoxin [Oleiagrimonas sp. MCCC 1A03011]|uniref:thioredoxin n=1 Tax=Oleiagrimonas sp. MCCC 1A03011 TaxID=1926883 RepID=UPI000DC5D365|nr:thioredoxin [Oleiagrimonas sp. MCCC 1A03011]RAP57458.1 thioredoxin [Oleiagrimonas sp. MCCC 1A03011]